MVRDPIGSSSSSSVDLWRMRDFWGDAFAWAGSATPHVLPRVLAFGGVSALICTFARPELGLPVGPHEVAGAVLTLLLVIRSNAGYDRWWEARKLWGGIVNQTRNLAIQALSYGPADPAWRDEIVRCLTQPGATAVQAAGALGLSRATLYRKIAQYGIRVPGRRAQPTGG